MNKLFSKFLYLTLVFSFMMALSIPAHAEETTTEEPTAVEETTEDPVAEVTEEETSDETTDESSTEESTDEAAEEVVEEVIPASTTITLTIADEISNFAYTLVVSEDGTFTLPEGVDEESAALLAELDFTDLDLVAVLDLVSATVVGESESFASDVFLSSNNQEQYDGLVTTLTETYGEVLSGEVVLPEVTEEEPEELTNEEYVHARIEHARELGIAPGKMNLIQRLERLMGSELDYEQYADMNVPELMKEMKEYREHLEDVDDEELSETDERDTEATEELTSAPEPKNTKAPKEKSNNGKAKGRK